MSQLSRFASQTLFCCAVLLCGALLISTGAEAAGASGSAARQCSFSDMQACRSCAELSQALEPIEPHDGRYEDNIKWSPLFGAFLKNCQALGKQLLEKGADPNLGGRFGSMLVSVSTEWSRRDQRSSMQWAQLLMQGGADLDAVLPDSFKSARQLVESGMIKIDYTSIWALFD